MRLQPNPNANKFVLPEGYRDIGWQMTLENPDYAACVVAHQWKDRREFDNSTFRNRCTDVITICDTCKIVWHTDMSD